MKHKCFISFKTEDFEYKRRILEDLRVDMIDKSLNEPIDSYNEDYIMRKIREDYLSDSTVTIFLIGNKSSEYYGWEEQKYIKRELQASLYNCPNNTRNGILGVVLPSMYDKVYQGSYLCSKCYNNHDWVAINDATVIKEFSYNYYLPLSSDKCAWTSEDRYCILVKWDDFKENPEYYIDQAYNKRFSNIASRVKVRP